MTFLVTRADDPAAAHTGMSLRDAITAANTDGNPADVDVINFDPALAGKTITLDPAQGELQIQESVTIQGLGASNLTIDGGAVGGVGGVRIFDLFGGVTNPDQVTTTGLTLQNGNQQTGGNPEVDGGGAIGTDDPSGSNGFGISFFGPTQADSLTVQGCVLKNNTTNGVGGAIAVTGGNLTIQDSTIANNVSGNEGGGIFFDDRGNSVQLQMDRDTVANNTANTGGHEQGGGLCIQGGAANVISACTFSGNMAGGEGGAIANRPTGAEIPVPTNSANTVIQNSTIFNNTANDVGGGVWNGASALTLRNDTIDQNTSLTGGGSGVRNDFGTVNILNTIVAGNSDSSGQHDLSQTGTATTNAQFSLIQSPNGAVNGTNSNNIFGVSPNLGPLQNNGGPTMTQALLPGSPAIDAGQDGVVAADQRGVPRPQGAHTDIGAFEFFIVQGLTGVAAVNGNEFTPLTNVPVATFNNPGSAVAPASLSATINWGDNTPASAGVIIASGSTYTVLGSHTYAEHAAYTITTTIGGNGGAPAVSTAAIGEEQLPGQSTAGRFDQRLVAEIFRDLSGHGIDALSLAVWTRVLDSATAALDQIYLAAGLSSDQALALAFSQAAGGVTLFIEFEVGFLPPAGTPLQMLSANYQQLLDRPLDAAGANFYLPLFAQGIPDQGIVSFIVGSLTFEYIAKVA